MNKQNYRYKVKSMLLTYIYERIEWNSEALHVEFDISTRKWPSTYHPKPLEPIEFEKAYSETKGIEKFKNIIEYSNWHPPHFSIPSV